MNTVQKDELVRVSELLRRTGEFIAYFELAETKMMEWRQEIERQSAFLVSNTQALQNELTLVQQLFSQSGAEQFHNTVTKALSQGEKQAEYLDKSCGQFNNNFQIQQQQLKALSDKSLEKIEKYTQQAIQNITTVLSKYDVNHFHRIASESCDHVERAASDAVNKSNKLLNSFQLRFNFIATITTLITSFIVVFYLSDEFPWEMHHQAMKERQAGKVLLQAWPNLSQMEKNKILTPLVPPHG